MTVQVGKWSFVLISVHLKATGLNNEDIDSLRLVVMVTECHTIFRLK